MRRSLLWIAILSGVIGLTGVAQSADPSVESVINDIQNDLAPAVVAKGREGSHITLASRMAALHVPGTSVAVIHNGRIAWARGFGVTRLGGAPVTQDTLFQAGSISKPVTAMAVLHLVQAGRLSLDTDVNSYLKSWKVPENEFTKQKAVTLRGLLSHTAGVTVHGFPGYASGMPVANLVQVLNGEKPANTPAIRVDTIPGTLWRYSGGGYVITQQMLIDLTAQSFPAFMHDTVLGPLGMTHSTYEQPLPARMQREAATPYDEDGVIIAGGAHTYPEMAPAGLWTTPSDLARYAIGVQQALAGKSRVLSNVTASEMVKNVGMGHFGLGLAVGGQPENPYFNHDGADEGFVSNLVAYNHGDGAIIMTNGMNGGRLAQELLRTIAREYNWPDFKPKETDVAAVAPELLDGYAGDYRQGRFTVVTLAHIGDHLVATQGKDDLGTLYPATERDWFFTASSARLTFQVNSEGSPTAFVRHSNEFDTTATRISASDKRAIAEELTAKVNNQTQDQKAEAALRRTIQELQLGKPDYDKMSPLLARAIKQGLPDLHQEMADFGVVKSVAFKGVTPTGTDMYHVMFDNKGTKWRLILDSEGKIESLWWDTLP